MDEQVFELVTSQLSNLNSKVDELLAFKQYFLGVSAAVAAVVSSVIGWIFRSF